MTVRVWRKGGSSPYWQHGWSATVDYGEYPRVYAREPHEAGLRLQMEISAAGGGSTRLVIGFSPQKFSVIAQAMMQADPNEAIKAFGAAMQAGIPPAPEKS